MPECPLEAGSYTFTQGAGGFLTPDGLDPFPFPPGGTILLDVGTPDADCVHPAVAPATTGFVVPQFCIGTVNFNVSVVQSGCGIGQIDSDGGSDYEVREIGDTSSPTVCGAPLPDTRSASSCSRRKAPMWCARSPPEGIASSSI